MHNLLSRLALAATGAVLAAVPAQATPRPAPEAQALRYLAAADAAAAGVDPAAARASATIEAQVERCVDEASPAVEDELTWLPVRFEYLLTQKLLASGYQRFARSVAGTRPRDPTLARLAASVARLAPQDARLSRVRIDLCRFLDDWRAAGWKASYADVWYAASLREAGIDARLVRRLDARLEALAPGLRRLGLGRAQADRLVVEAELTI